MNTGAEAVETALKLARKWGYLKKKIPQGKALIVNCTGCFHGRTIGIVSMSDDPDAYNDYSPLLPGFISVPFNDADALAKVFAEHGENIAGFLVEPIQGEAGIMIPDDGYLKKCGELCKEHNVLFITDEIQTGLCRTGKLLASDWDGVRGDILILGKALSGGLMPISAVLSSKEIMHCFTPGTHGSTFGGNPLASAVAISALQVLRDENLADRSQKMGQKLLEALRNMSKSFIKEVRGRGLMLAIEMDPNYPRSAMDVCLVLAKKGILCKPTHENIIRLAPPLVITEQEVNTAIRAFQEAFDVIEKGSDIPKESDFP
eukprot:TRINITY_DN3697_c0_g1_i1.p1 TRINITY_DN3697_c0_g1~~TRINITY_DN3697_c0_g1_i1.p1  ORF type:complete len:317 (-),score=52.66 TRINITY_DN3697_c0_g1_i1:31-981(-)